MRTVVTLTRRELAAYFASPLAYVFVVIFLVFAGGLTFYVGGFIERGQADLVAFLESLSGEELLVEEPEIPSMQPLPQPHN